jgi:hypothetical protein
MNPGPIVELVIRALVEVAVRVAYELTTQVQRSWQRQHKKKTAERDVEP